MTLIKLLDAHFNSVRRCDARCYDAKGDHCDCVCRGRNHGVALEAALRQTLLVGFANKDPHLHFRRASTADSPNAFT